MNISSPLIKIIVVALNTLTKLSGTDNLPVTDLE